MSSTVFSQENLTSYINPEATVNISTKTPWSYSFSVGNRSSFYEEGVNEFTNRFLELTHFTSLQTGFHSKMSLGIRYRFKEMYNENSVNETILVQQYAHTKKTALWKIAHRARFTQRFDDVTAFRSRYRFSAEVPVSGIQVDVHEFYLIGSTEATWQIGKAQKPFLGQRVSFQIGNRITKNSRINIGTEYRYRNYLQDPYQELFLITSLKISL